MLRFDPMGRTISRAARLVFQPVPEAWGWGFSVIPGLAALIAWWQHYGLWAAGVFGVTLILLLAQALVRSQRQADALVHRREVLDGIGTLLVEGEGCKSRIGAAAFMHAVRTKVSMEELSEQERELFEDDEWAKWLDGWHDESSAWASRTVDYLKENLGRSFAARFVSTTGLTPSEPHGSFPYASYIVDGDKPFRFEFQSVEWHCQRLYEIVREVQGAP